MPTDPRLQAVEHFYDFHPISAAQIFDAVAARGVARDQITEEVLQHHDQDHYGGTDAVDRLMAQAAVVATDQVLDICSGLGGPARYLAWKTGCQVTGLDLTASRVEGATALTEAAGLADRVRFHQGNALALPFPDASFTLAISQEAFAHIPEKSTLVAGIARVLRPGGRLVFSDILSRGALARDDATRLCDGMRFNDIATEADYRRWMQGAGLEGVQVTDLSETWTRILVERHAMYRSLKAQTVARLGAAHFDRYDQAYEHFVGLYRSGVLAGALFHARRPG
ncbi:methylase involved in ubiquinone/menaquinone biosynthesis [Burkholderiales bacterium JOSHI_001]|nr:methylase involved in ubiquinone/menaquinone biosynthesis [Burkholderiales bacterium JOSHI_001]